ncbi:C40 family peptidase [Kitasatospora sp. NPDC049285]|uniref:C40 family peptidase n=1 Tax=Kitasatospora sp. NPDC049285 TaxID=3157096 RepID=UPI003414112F
MKLFRAYRKIGCLGLLLVCSAAALCGLAIISMIDGADPGATAPVGSVGGIPPRLMEAYVRAAAAMPQLDPECKGMSWQLLAGIGKVESGQAEGHQIDADGLVTPPIIGPILNGSGAGGNITPVYDTDQGRWDGNSQFDAAVGVVQFLPSTFASYADKVRPEGGASPQNVDDETLAAALYLCQGKDLTDPQTLHNAILRYNYSSAYVDEVLRWMKQYTELGDPTTTVPTGDASEQAQQVIAAAASQFGVPYSWGGGDATGKTTGICCSEGGQDGRTVTGFDCSGLMVYAFAKVGVRLPRVAADQAGVGQRIPASAGVSALRPGDMVFFGNAKGIYHVGLYIGGGQMINAPKPGDVVKQAAVWNYDYAGGARVIG